MPLLARHAAMPWLLSAAARFPSTIRHFIIATFRRLIFICCCFSLCVFWHYWYAVFALFAIIWFTFFVFAMLLISSLIATMMLIFALLICRATLFAFASPLFSMPYTHIYTLFAIDFLRFRWYALFFDIDAPLIYWYWYAFFAFDFFADIFVFWWCFLWLFSDVAAIQWHNIRYYTPTIRLLMPRFRHCHWCWYFSDISFAISSFFFFFFQDFMPAFNYAERHFSSSSLELIFHVTLTFIFVICLSYASYVYAFHDFRWCFTLYAWRFHFVDYYFVAWFTSLLRLFFFFFFDNSEYYDYRWRFFFFAAMPYVHDHDTRWCRCRFLRFLFSFFMPPFFFFFAAAYFFAILMIIIIDGFFCRQTLCMPAYFLRFHFLRLLIIFSHAWFSPFSSLRHCCFIVTSFSLPFSWYFYFRLCRADATSLFRHAPCQLFSSRLDVEMMIAALWFSLFSLFSFMPLLRHLYAFDFAMPCFRFAFFAWLFLLLLSLIRQLIACCFRHFLFRCHSFALFLWCWCWYAYWFSFLYFRTPFLHHFSSLRSTFFASYAMIHFRQIRCSAGYGLRW